MYAVIYTFTNSFCSEVETIWTGTLKQCAAVMSNTVGWCEHKGYAIERVPDQAKVVCTNGHVTCTFECVRA